MKQEACGPAEKRVSRRAHKTRGWKATQRKEVSRRAHRKQEAGRRPIENKRLIDGPTEIHLLQKFSGSRYVHRDLNVVGF